MSAPTGASGRVIEQNAKVWDIELDLVFLNEKFIYCHTVDIYVLNCKCQFCMYTCKYGPHGDVITVTVDALPPNKASPLAGALLTTKLHMFAFEIVMALCHFELQWNLSVTTTSKIKCITCYLFSDVL